MGLDRLSQDGRVANGRVEGLVAAAFDVIDILAHDLPVFKLESFLSQDTVRVFETIEDESAPSAPFPCVEL